MHQQRYRNQTYGGDDERNGSFKHVRSDRTMIGVGVITAAAMVRSCASPLTRPSPCRKALTMRRYLEMWGIMLRNSLIRELSFKANFILWMVVEVLWFCGQVGFFSIIFGQVDRIGDWSKWEVILLVGTHQMIAQLFQAFFFVNVSNIPELVRTGRLDSLLVLPIDSQFAVSTKQFGLDSVLNAVLGGFVVIVALTKLQVTPSLAMIALYLVAICFGVAIHYSIMLTLAAISFWIVRAQGLGYGYLNFNHNPR